MTSPDVVAVINTSPDTVELLKDALERAGFIVVNTYTHAIRDGEIDLEAFLRTFKPKVILYDISPPYERNWALFQSLRETVLRDYRFVLTSVNTAQVERLVKHDQRIYEVVGHSDDLDALVQATREAARARDTR